MRVANSRSSATLAPVSTMKFAVLPPLPGLPLCSDQLPAVTLSLGGLATIARFTRAGMLETLQKDFVTYERAQGFPGRALIWKFVLKNPAAQLT